LPCKPLMITVRRLLHDKDLCRVRYPAVPRQKEPGPLNGPGAFRAAGKSLDVASPKEGAPRSPLRRAAGSREQNAPSKKCLSEGGSAMLPASARHGRRERRSPGFALAYATRETVILSPLPCGKHLSRPVLYCDCRVSAGWTAAARCAGIQLAMNATTRRAAGVALSVSRSVGLTP
jgi:hypothetical protein